MWRSTHAREFQTGRISGLVAFLLCAPFVLANQDAPPKKEDVWKPVRFLVGTWDGLAEGEAGRGNGEADL
jgi:hypothetical protein